MKKIKVLEFCESYGGGVKTQIDNIISLMDKDRFEIHWLLNSNSDEVFSDFNLNIKPTLNRKHPFSTLKTLKRLSVFLQQQNIDLVHAHSTFAGLYILLMHIFLHCNIPVVFTPHAYFSEKSNGTLKNKLICFIERMINRNAQYIIHVSSEEEKHAISMNLLRDTNSIVINNGIPEPIEVTSKKISNSYRYMNVARCDYQKNPDLFIRIAKWIVESDPDAVCEWVGDGALLDVSREKVEKMGLTDKIQFSGYSNEIPLKLSQANCFLSTSRYEGQPFSVIEALAFGKPVILTDVVGHRELVENNGVLLKSPVDKETLLRDVTLVKQNMSSYSNKSKQIYKKKYKVSKMIHKISNVYMASIESKGSKA